MAAPKPEGTLATSLEVAPAATLKCFQVLIARASSSYPRSVTFEGALDDPFPMSKIIIFDNWEVTKGIFKDFICPVDAKWVIWECNYQHWRDAILSVIRVSFPFYF